MNTTLFAVAIPDPTSALILFLAAALGGYLALSKRRRAARRRLWQRH